MSSTTTTSGLVKPWATVADWDEPETTTTAAAAPGSLVRLKLAGVVTPATEAVSVYGPAFVFGGGSDARVPVGVGGGGASR